MFNFAWADAEEAFGPEHLVEDEEILSFAIEAREGDFATLSLVIRNPRIGFLSSGRKQWAWLSYQGNPLFFGRLVGIPTDLLGEACTLQFVAKPIDYDARKIYLTDGLKVLPFYDPLFIDDQHRDDPDAVMEAYSAMIHVDRVTHEVTISDDLVGEDGLEEFGDDEVPYDSVSIQLDKAPLTSIRVDAIAPWTQQSSGFIDMGASVHRTLTGSSLISDWPKPGTDLGGGWAVDTDLNRGSDAFGPIRTYGFDENGIAAAKSVSNSTNWSSKAAEHINGDIISVSVNSSDPGFKDSYNNGLTEDKWEITYGEDQADPDNPFSFGSPDRYTSGSKSSAKWEILPIYSVRTRLILTYGAGIERRERALFDVSADLQAIVTLSDEAQETIAITAAKVDAAIDGQAPLPNPDGGSYFQTDRGHQSLHYLLLLARARLRLRSRAVAISFDCRFERAVALSCRKNARLTDHRIPGGVAEGKISSYSITADADSGMLIGKVTMACAIGQDGTIVSSPGTGLYVDDDYVENYYERENETISITDDVGLTPPTYAGIGFPFPLSRDDVVLYEQWHGSLEDQIAALSVPITITKEQEDEDFYAGRQARQLTLSDRIEDHAIWYELHLRPVDNLRFSSDVEVPVTDLKLPRQINLG